jgi:hypothetical protein
LIKKLKPRKRRNTRRQQAQPRLLISLPPLTTAPQLRPSALTL